MILHRRIVLRSFVVAASFALLLPFVATTAFGASGQPDPQVPPSNSGQETSQNWSGYIATTGTYTGVTGTWNVPEPAGGTGGVGSTWVGIGGATSQDLIQAGTQDTTQLGDQHQYEAWIEMLPLTSQQIPVAVTAGDSITVSISEMGAGSGSWWVSLMNNTSGESFETTVDYASSESSAEWIEEAPTGACGVLPLDNFKSVSFTASTAEQNGATVNLVEANAQPITLVNAAGQTEAVPSAIAADGASFDVTRTPAPSTPDAASVARCVRRAQP